MPCWWSWLGLAHLLWVDSMTWTLFRLGRRRNSRSSPQFDESRRSRHFDWRAHSHFRSCHWRFAAAGKEPRINYGVRPSPETRPFKFLRHLAGKWILLRHCRVARKERLQKPPSCWVLWSLNEDIKVYGTKWSHFWGLEGNNTGKEVREVKPDFLVVLEDLIDLLKSVLDVHDLGLKRERLGKLFWLN